MQQEPLRFPVRFHAARVGQPANAFDLAGKGQVEIGNDFLTLRGVRHRTLRPPTPVVETVHLVNVVNVWRDGPHVGCTIQTSGGAKPLAFASANFDAARAIQERLPQRQTESFAAEQADYHAFHDRIDHWSPHTPATFVILALICMIFGLQLLDRVQLIEFWGANNARATLAGEHWRLISSIFLHGHLVHLALNGLTIYQLGTLVERMFGTPRFILLFLVSGIIGGIASAMANPHGVSLGASGAAFGLMGGLLAFISRPDSGVPMTIAKAMRSSASMFLLLSAAAGMMINYIDNAAHLGGLVGGYLAGLLLARSLHIPAKAKNRDKAGSA
jgi:rhomboid protease GluP